MMRPLAAAARVRPIDRRQRAPTDPYPSLCHVLRRKHGDTLTLRNAKRVPVQPMSLAESDRRTGPFFVMAAAEYRTQAGHAQEPGLTAEFLHESSHTHQLPGMAALLGPIGSAWNLPVELSDDVVQARFGSRMPGSRTARARTSRGARANAGPSAMVVAGRGARLPRRGPTLPEWPSHAFRQPSIGAVEPLQRAVRQR